MVTCEEFEQIIKTYISPLLPNVEFDYKIFHAKGGSSPYSSEHPFSAWILKNQEILKSNYPGLYWPMIDILLNEGGNAYRINHILDQFRKIPHPSIEIPASITPYDFLDPVDWESFFSE